MDDDFGAYARIHLGDRDLDKRFVLSLKQLGTQPEASPHRACGSASQSKALYRLVANEKLTDKSIVDVHHDVTMERIRESGASVVVVSQDTTEINFSSLKNTTGLGNIGTNPKLRGLIVHSAIAVSPQGEVLGLLDQKIWTREPEERGKKKNRAVLPIEEKESYKWLECMKHSQLGCPENVRLVYLSDREGDVYEYFEAAQLEQCQFICRRVQNRMVQETERTIQVFLDKQPVAGTYRITVPRDSHTQREERTAEMEIRYGKVHVCPPKNIRTGGSRKNALELQVISAQEVRAEEGAEALCWQLITNMPVEDFETAHRCVQWYTRRWMIELFHRTLKEGCAIEKLQSETAQRLSKLIEMYSIIAMRIMRVTYLARCEPDISCEAVLRPVEWKILYRTAKRTTQTPQTPPTVREAMIMIAQLGGFSGYKSSGSPGIKVMWWGMSKLLTFLHALPFFSDFVG